MPLLDTILRWVAVTVTFARNAETVTMPVVQQTMCAKGFFFPIPPSLVINCKIGMLSMLPLSRRKILSLQCSDSASIAIGWRALHRLSATIFLALFRLCLYAPRTARKFRRWWEARMFISRLRLKMALSGSLAFSEELQLHPPQAVQDNILLSELGYCLLNDIDGVGVNYILMYMLQASPLQWNCLESKSCRHVLQQLAKIFITLERHSFHQTGSTHRSTC